MSQGLVEARVAKVWAGMATITLTSFVSKRFSSSKFKMMGSMDIGKEGNRRGLEERNEINCEDGRCSTIKDRMEGFCSRREMKSSSDRRGSTSCLSTMIRLRASSGRLDIMADLLLTMAAIVSAGI